MGAPADQTTSSESGPGPDHGPDRGPASGADLARVLGVPGAVSLGLGSMLGTGLFVGLAMAAAVAGNGAIIALGLAGAIATCSGLSSARLAARHPVSGGTYAYGRRLFGARTGFVAGWLFLLAKGMSAGTAALGLAAYLLAAAGVDANAIRLRGLAAGLVGLATLAVILGLRRTRAVNAALLVLTLAGLAVAIVAMAPATPGGVAALGLAGSGPGDLGWGTPTSWLQAAGLLYVAYAGYGRVATLGEEVRDPARTIPRAVGLTLLISAAIAAAVLVGAIGAVGATAFGATVSDGATRAPLLEVLELLGGHDGLRVAVVVGAGSAMAGVLLTLVLGLSRVLFAMGRDGALPTGLGRVHAGRGPLTAVFVVGLAIAALVLATDDLRVTWSISAAAVLAYYAITNACALRMARQDRTGWLVPSAGLIGCVGLGVAADSRSLAIVAGSIALGLLVHWIGRRAGGDPDSARPARPGAPAGPPA